MRAGGGRFTSSLRTWVFRALACALLLSAARQVALLRSVIAPNASAMMPRSPHYFVPPTPRALPPGEPMCGAPAPRPPACEAWCAVSPLAPFATTLAADGRGCWQAPTGAAGAPPLLRGSDAAQLPRLVMLYTGFNGLADTLAGAVTAFYIAALAGAEFHMRFSGSKDDPHFLWAFEPNCLDALSTEWSATGAPPPLHDAFPLARTHYSFDIFHLPPEFARIVASGNLRELWMGNAVLSLHTHVGLVHELLLNPRYATQFRAAGISAHNAFAEAYHFLLRPRALGLVRFRDELAALTTSSTVRIGIHVRTGVHYDRSFAPDAPPLGVANFTSFFDCAREVADGLATARAGGGLFGSATQPRPNTQWFLLSDSVALRADAARRFPKTLIARTAEVDVRHSRTSTLTTPFAEAVTCTSFLDAAMEHWLFGLADAHVVSQWSGFGRTGALVHVVDVAGIKPMFQLSASKPMSAFCALYYAARIEDIVEHPPGL